MSEFDPASGHPIQVVARRTGLTPDVLRAWEKRYEAVSPSRSATGRRFYSDRDVERLLLLRRATLAGRSIGQIARLGDDELRDLVTRDETAERAERASREPAGPGKAAPVSADEGFLSDCLAAVKSLDAAGLESALHRASFALSRPQLLDSVLMPLMREIGSLWNDGTLRISHEHLASAVVRSFLGAIREAGATVAGAPEILVGTPAGQAHELGAAMVGATAASAGWKVTYLGPNLPTEELAAAAAQRRCRVIALSIVYPADDPLLGAEFRKLRQLTPAEIEIVAGGSASEAYAAELQAIGIRRLADMAAFRSFLNGMR